MSAQGDARIFAVGANHRSSGAMLRDRLFIDDAMVPRTLDRLRNAGLGQAIILSTCDRIEIQGIHPEAERMATVIRDDFCATSNVGGDEIADQSYAHYDAAALRHIFAVAASLDSQVIGEPQVLGQVRAAHRLSADSGMMGPEFEAVLQAAYGVAKRVRTETQITRRPVSIASAAAQVAQDLHGDLSRCRALIVGLGEIGELIHDHMRQAGLRDTALTGPSQRMESAARRAGLHFVPYVELAAELALSDIVVSAAGTGRRIITAELVEGALRERRRRPILFLDGGVPSDMDAALERHDGAYLYTLDDLEQVALEGRTQRQEASADAWCLVEDGVAAWQRRQAERDAVPSVVALRDHFEQVRQEVLAEHPNADPEEVTRLLINRLLHRPSTALRDLAASDEAGTVLNRTQVEQLLGLLFADPSNEEER